MTEEPKKEGRELVPRIENLYEYMIKNHEQIIRWIRSFMYFPASQNKIKTIKQNLQCDTEEFIQEAYYRLLRTFYDNEQRKDICLNCTHKCSGYLNKRKRNTERSNSKYDCKPYMDYDYTEAGFHNYIKVALAQNLDNKLVAINRNPLSRLDEKIGDDDSPDLKSLLSKLANQVDSETAENIKSKLLGKKLLFTHKIEEYKTLPEIAEYEEYEFENPNYNKTLEDLKAKRRKVYEASKLAMPKNLMPQPETIKAKMKIPAADVEAEMWSRIGEIPDLWETKWDYVEAQGIELKKTLREDAENRGLIEIKPEVALEDLSEEDINAMMEDFSIPVDEILPDDYLKEIQIQNGYDPEEVENDYNSAMAEIEEFIPSDPSEPIKEFTLDNFCDLDEVRMKYDSKTEIRIVSKDFKVIPLPMCVYSEISIEDFLDLAFDVENNPEKLVQLQILSEENSTYKEIWADLGRGQYNICESVSYSDPYEVRYLRRVKLRKLIERFGKRTKKECNKKVCELFLQDRSKESDIFNIDSKFTSRVLKVIKEYITKAPVHTKKSIGFSKMNVKVLKKKNISEAERIEEAKNKVMEVLELRQRIRDNQIEDIDTSKVDTSRVNLNPHKLFSQILRELPKTRSYYATSEEEVLCISRSEETKAAMSVSLS